MDKNIEVTTGTEGAKMIEEINKVLTEKSAEPLTPEELAKYKDQFTKFLAKLKGVQRSYNPSKKKLTDKQKKLRKSKRKTSNKSRKINQAKNRHNKFTR